MNGACLYFRWWWCWTEAVTDTGWPLWQMVAQKCESLMNNSQRRQLLVSFMRKRCITRKTFSNTIHLSLRRVTCCLNIILNSIVMPFGTWVQIMACWFKSLRGQWVDIVMCFVFQGDPPVYSHSIITVEADKSMSWLHERMPVCYWLIDWLIDLPRHFNNSTQ